MTSGSEPSPGSARRRRDAGATYCRGFEMVIEADRPLPFPPVEDGAEANPDVRVAKQPGLAREIPSAQLGRLEEGGCGIGYGGWVFDLRVDRRQIAYAPHPEAEALIPFEHVVERMVLPIYASIARPDRICLHAGAVECRGDGWLFIGSTGAGKSTTVYHSVVARGARAYADEMAVVDTATFGLLPGSPALRLPETVDSFPEAVDSGPVHPAIAKRWFRLDASHVGRETVPITGIVYLQPDDLEGDEAGLGRLEPIGHRHALLAVLEETFDFEEAHAAWKRRRFRGASRLSGGVEVWRYRFNRAQPAPRRVRDLWAAIDDRDSPGDDPG